MCGTKTKEVRKDIESEGMAAGSQMPRKSLPPSERPRTLSLTKEE